MKQTNICPKCQSTDVARIEPFKATSGNNYIQLSKWGTQLGYVERYICIKCGFTEQYVDMNDKGWQKWLEEKRKERSLDSDFV